MKGERIMSFADRLKISRKEKGYSQETLAEELEVSRRSITKWETGAAFPELKKLLLLSVALDKDLDWLMCDERNALIVDKGPELRMQYEHSQIYDMKSLEAAVMNRRIRGILECLDGTEFNETIDGEDFSGVRTYVIFGSRMYVASKGINPITGEQEEAFLELKSTEAIEILLRHAQKLGNLEE